jgi:hypothetical protein
MVSDQGFFPQSPSVSQESGNQQAPATQAAGEQTVDTSFADELEQELLSVKEESARNKQEFGKVSETLNKVKQAFGHEAAPEADPDEIDKQFLDRYLEAALESEKQGRPIPLTAQLAVKLVEQNKLMREMQKKLNKVTEGVGVLADPETTYDNNAYAAIETSIYKTIQNLYGEYDKDLGQACGTKVANEIKRIKRENPQGWNNIRSSPQLIESLAMYAVEKVIPPKARDILKAENLRSTKMGREELVKALRENNAETKDPQQRAMLNKKIRQDILSQMLPFGR